MKNHKKPIMFGLNQSQCVKLVLQVHKTDLKTVWEKRLKNKISYELFKRKYKSMIDFLEINTEQFGENYTYKAPYEKYVMAEEKSEKEMINSENYNLEDVKKEISSKFLVKWSNETTKEPHQITIGELKKMTPEKQSKILKSIL
jgi:hypothetical protein